MIQYERDCSSNMGNAVMKLIRLNQVLALTGLSRGTIYRMERAGSFPLRRRLGTNSVAWIEHEITTWMESRPAARETSSNRAA
jgi:prophage regulatory protein